MGEGEPLLMTLDQVAELTGLPLRPLLDDCRSGRIEHVHRGRERYMTRAQVDALIRAHTVTPPAIADRSTALDKVRDRRARRRGRC